MRKQDYKYHKQISLGIGANGKVIRKHVYANSQRELNDQIIKLKIEYEKYKDPTEMTFKQYADQWNEAYNQKKSVRTREYYNSGISLLENIHHKKLKAVTKTDMQTIINGYSDHPRTCEKIVQVAAAIFASAIIDGKIVFNPALKLTYEKYKAPEKRAFTDEEVAAIKKADLDPRERMVVDLFFYFGFRPEELRALMPTDFNLETNEVTINKAVTFNGNSPLLKTTKNKKVRTIPIPNALLPELTDYLEKNLSFYLFPMRDGNPMSKTSWLKFSKKVFAKINAALGGDENIDKLNGMTWYTFRHNCGTRLYYINGISTKYKAYFLGHTEPVFISTYSHLDAEKEDVSALKQIVM